MERFNALSDFLEMKMLRPKPYIFSSCGYRPRIALFHHNGRREQKWSVRSPEQAPRGTGRRRRRGCNCMARHGACMMHALWSLNFEA
jgi:hypothetical protein